MFAPKDDAFAEVGVSNWPSGGRPHCPPSLSRLLYPPSASFLHLLLSPSTSLFLPLFSQTPCPLVQVTAQGQWDDITGPAPSSLSACCTITDCCSSSVVHCEVCERAREKITKRRRDRGGEEGDRGREKEKQTVLLNWDWRKKKGGESVEERYSVLCVASINVNTVVVMCVGKVHYSL